MKLKMNNLIKPRNTITWLIILMGIVIFNSCEKAENEKKGYVTFGANYHAINCITTVTVYIENENVGTLNNPTDSLMDLDCGEDYGITKELPVGEHSYKIEIRPETGTGCTRDTTGTFIITENKCEKIFIDYHEIFANQFSCDQDVVISETEYLNAPEDPFHLSEMKIEGDCLHIRFSASGCSGDTWIVKLIDSGAIAESIPPQRTLRLSLKNPELCLAVIGKEMSFNIKDLQIPGKDKTILRVSGEKILYEY